MENFKTKTLVKSQNNFSVIKVKSRKSQETISNQEVVCFGFRIVF